MNWIRYLKGIHFSGELIIKKNLSECSYIAIGGYATVMAYPHHQNDLKEILIFAKTFHIHVYILGNGSNTLFSDQHLDAIVISLKAFQRKIIFIKNAMSVTGDVRLEKILNMCCQRGLSGLEFLVGIPGYLMSSIACNTGASFFSICDCLSDIFYIDQAGNEKHLTKKELSFAYRKGPLKEFGIIYKALFELNFISQNVIKKKISEYLDYKKRTQPLGLKSLGCVFKNPSSECSAGQMLDELGLKGFSIGGIGISQRHANFFINNGKGSFDDFQKLFEIVQNLVMKKRGIALESEIKIVGSHV